MSLLKGIQFISIQLSDSEILDTQQNHLEIFKTSDAQVNKSELFGLKKIN